MISHCLIIAGGKRIKILDRAGKEAHVFQTDQETAEFIKLFFLCISHPAYKGLCCKPSPAIPAASSPPPPNLVVSCLTNSRFNSDTTQLHHLDSDCLILLSSICAAHRAFLHQLKTPKCTSLSREPQRC